MRRIDRQRGARLDIGRGLARTAGEGVTAKRPALLVRVGHLRPSQIRGRGIDRTVVVNDQPAVLARLLHPAAGEAGMGRVLVSTAA